jgi:hypothetical protein
MAIVKHEKITEKTFKWNVLILVMDEITRAG